MSRSVNRRCGFSLLELIVVVAIFGIIVGLTLVGIQKVRSAAVRTTSVNNLRQIMLGVHMLADEKMGEINKLPRANADYHMGGTDNPLFYLILPYVHANRPTVGRADMSPQEFNDLFHPVVPIYRSPADPTWDINPVLGVAPAKCSYVFNMTAVSGGLKIPFSFPDGTTNTIAVAEHYYYCKSEEMYLNYSTVYGPHTPENPYGSRRATFADSGWGDIVPVTDPATKTTRASVPGKTFQVRPTPDEASGFYPSTPFEAGLPVAMFDGSVRTISPRVTEAVFWSAVTPAGREVVAGEF